MSDNLLGLQPASPDPQIEAEQVHQLEVEEEARHEVRRNVTILASCVLAVLCLLAGWHGVQAGWDAGFRWFLHATGSDAPGSVEYNFWSGFGSDIMEFALLGGLVQIVRHLNCHEGGQWPHGCKGWGSHEYVDKNGVKHKVCRKHHPLLGKGHSISHQDLLADAAEQAATI
jgi:hypothetical protein